MNQQHHAYLHAMDITVWEKQKMPKATETAELPADWSLLFQQVRQCTKCGLDRSRKNTVFGAGSDKADLMIIGEAPGASEDQQGAPFVGRAGLLLTEMLKSIGISREQVFITNILKCRPPNNRDPLPYEVECCTPYLTAQIEHIQPKLIIAVGRIAAHFLLNTTTSLSRLRGQLYEYGEKKTPLIVTFHPAYLLRSPSEKAKAYEDLLMVRKTALR